MPPEHSAQSELFWSRLCPVHLSLHTQSPPPSSPAVTVPPLCFPRDRERERKYSSSEKESQRRRRRRRRSYSPLRKRRRDSPSHLEARRITRYGAAAPAFGDRLRWHSPGQHGLCLGPSPCQWRSLQQEPGFPEPDQQALLPLLELEEFQPEAEGGWGGLIYNGERQKAGKVRAGTRPSSARSIAPQAFRFTFSCDRSLTGQRESQILTLTFMLRAL